jgi:hypothetical protein
VFPYLNPYKEHSHSLDITILVDGFVDPIMIHGGGEGWSVVYLPLPTRREYKRSSLRHLTVLSSLLIPFYFYTRYLETHWGMPMTEISFRALVAYIPALVIFGGFSTWIIRKNFQFVGRFLPRKHAEQ